MAAGDLSALRLSGAGNDGAVLLAATAAPGTLVHTAHATSLDEVFADVYNQDTTDRTLTIELVSGTIILVIPSRTIWIPVLMGYRMTGSFVLRMYASVTNVLFVAGRVNRID